jgi:hypothetical protein
MACFAIQHVMAEIERARGKGFGGGGGAENIGDECVRA